MEKLIRGKMLKCSCMLKQFIYYSISITFIGKYKTNKSLKIHQLNKEQGKKSNKKTHVRRLVLIKYLEIIKIQNRTWKFLYFTVD